MCVGLAFIAAAADLAAGDSVHPQVCRDGACVSLNDTSSAIYTLISGPAPPLHVRPSFNRCCRSCEHVRSCSFSGGDEHHVVTLFLAHLRKRKGKRRFLEIGGFDGLFESNTLFMEHCLRWTGILVEAQPNVFEKLKQNRPGVLTLHAAACAGNETHVDFALDQTNGRVISEASKAKLDHSAVAHVPCVYLGHTLQKLNMTIIDYFSLDVQGYELQVVQSIDWSKIRAAVLVVEERRVDVRKNKLVADVLHTEAGMVRAFTLCWNTGRVCDGYFVHPQLVDVESLAQSIGAYNFAAEHLSGVGLGCNSSRGTLDMDMAKVHSLATQRQFLNASIDANLHATVPAHLTSATQRARAQAVPNGPARKEVPYCVAVREYRSQRLSMPHSSTQVPLALGCKR